MSEYDITKPTGFNPGIKAKNTQNVQFVRPVKVKTIGDLSYSDVEKIMWQNTVNGWQPAWEEIVEGDTPELDTVTLSTIVNSKKEEIVVHQTTMPIPLDVFPECIGLSLHQIMDYTDAICEREHWLPTYKNRMMVLVHLNMG